MTAVYRTAEGGRVVRRAYEALLDRWPVEHEKRTLSTRLGETFVVVSGPEDAPPVVALQGSGGTAAQWLPHIATLARRLRVYAVDAPGEPGLTVEARPRLGTEAYAEWLDDVLDELGVARAALLGVSLGGWWSLDYALRRPERVASLALLNPSGIGRRKTGPLLKFAALSMFGDWGRRRSLAAIAKGRQGPLDDEARALGAFTLDTFAHFKPRMEPIPEFGVERLHELIMPVQAQLGAQDVLLDQRETAAKLAEALPDADVRLVEDAGHFLPGWAENVVQFLAGPMTETHHGVKVMIAPGEGPELSTEQDAVDLVAILYGLGVDVIAIPVERFPDRFFDMRTQLIGHFFSKIVMLGYRLVVLGDVSRHVEASDTFRDVVYESNRGKDVWFLGDLGELDTRLAARR